MTTKPNWAPAEGTRILFGDREVVLGAYVGIGVMGSAIYETDDGNAGLFDDHLASISTGQLIRWRIADDVPAEKPEPKRGDVWESKHGGRYLLTGDRCADDYTYWEAIDGCGDMNGIDDLILAIGTRLAEGMPVPGESASDLRDTVAQLESVVGITDRGIRYKTRSGGQWYQWYLFFDRSNWRPVEPTKPAAVESMEPLTPRAQNRATIQALVDNPPRWALDGQLCKRGPTWEAYQRELCRVEDSAVRWPWGLDTEYVLGKVKPVVAPDARDGLSDDEAAWRRWMAERGLL